MKTRRILMLIAGLAAAATLTLAAAACNDDDDSDDGDNGDATSTPAPDGITVGDLVITEPSSRGAPDRGAVFFTVENGGDTDDALIAAGTEVASTVELHETVTEGASTMMRPVDKIDVPAGGSTVLESGGLHVMLTDLTTELTMGDEITVELEFENAGKVELTVEVSDYSNETMAPEGGM
jgi:copper(I)-binding protein